MRWTAFVYQLFNVFILVMAKFAHYINLNDMRCTALVYQLFNIFILFMAKEPAEKKNFLYSLKSKGSFRNVLNYYLIGILAVCYNFIH